MFTIYILNINIQYLYTLLKCMQYLNFSLFCTLMAFALVQSSALTFPLGLGGQGRGIVIIVTTLLSPE